MCMTLLHVTLTKHFTGDVFNCNFFCIELKVSAGIKGTTLLMICPIHHGHSPMSILDWLIVVLTSAPEMECAQ